MLFDKHVSYISKKCFGTLLFLNRIKENFDKTTRIILIQSLVLSIINYGLKVWGNTATCHIHQAQKIQNFAAKVALGGNKFDYATPYLRELKWLKICDMYKYELGITMYKIMTNRLPSWLFSFPRVRETHEVNTRHQHQLYVPKTKTFIGDRSLLVAGPKLWKSLPNHVTDTKCMSTFKRKLKNYLF